MLKMYSRYKSENEDIGNIFWTTMSDLMLGLAIIFIVLFVVSMLGFSKGTISKFAQTKELVENLKNNFEQANINVTIDEMTGNLKIPETTLFELNSHVLTPQGEKFLSELAPIYINTIFSNKNISKDITHIIIEGHTDSQTFAGIKSKDEQFIRNMDLSLKRANAVAAYILQTKYDKNNSEKLRKIIVVEGKSFNEPIIVNGQEDFAKSRRVELKLEVKDWNIASAFGLKL